MQVNIKFLFYIVKRQDILDGFTEIPSVAFTAIQEAYRECPEDCVVMTFREVMREIARNI